jgi:hypothetical protein
MRYVLSLAVVAAALAAAQPARAADSPLTIIVATCAPVSSVFKNDLDNRGAMRHAGSALGTVRVNCPIEATKVAGHSTHQIALTYRDSDGLSDATAVKAAVIEVSLVDGTQKIIATLDSSDRASTGITTGTKSFIYTFNQTFNYYYLEISATRATSSQKAIAYVADIK